MKLVKEQPENADDRGEYKVRVETCRIVEAFVEACWKIDSPVFPFKSEPRVIYKRSQLESDTATRYPTSIQR